MLDPNPHGYTVERLGPDLTPNLTPPARGGKIGRASLGAGNAAALMLEDLPPINYIVPGLIAEGLTLLGGKAKLGKSWLVLGATIAVATGGYVLGKIPVDEGDVLYLALEDNKRRLQKRLNQLLPTGRRPDRLFYDLTCSRIDNGLLDDLREWIVRMPDPRLVVIDVLNKVRPAQKANEGIYDYDVRSLEGLQGLAAEFGIAIVVIHHTRKAEAEDPFDCLSGSTGLTGTADSTLVLSRDSNGTTLYGRGRDIEEFEKALSFDRTTGDWTLMGEASEVRRSDERAMVLAVLSDAGEPMSTKEIMVASGLSNRNALDVLLYRMAKAGEIEKEGRGVYRHPLCPSPPCKNGKKVRSGDYRQERDGGDDE